MSAVIEVVKTFKVYNTEEAVLDKWLDEHKPKCKYWGDTPANPGHGMWFTPGSPITWTFHQSGIGDSIKVKCMCGEEVDITDYELF